MLTGIKQSIHPFRLFNLSILLSLLLHSPNALCVDYLTKIKPILAEKCYACHGTLKQESDLRLETRELMILGGDSGTVLDLINPRDSLLLERVNSQDSDRMPPEGEGAPLTTDQIALLNEWIKQGAVAPAEETPVDPADHWSFQPIQSNRSTTSIPTDQNLIDTLLAGKHSEQGIVPQAPASRPIQIRRIYLDLIGLPPTLEQLSDKRPIAEITNELLANPHHGERWARHWMDIWRYSDWYGLGEQLRNSQKHLWHWRDWIIQSLNEDKGYDLMIQEMLAGDELSPSDPSKLAATGFLARNYYLFNRTTWLDSTIEHTSKAFLGLTMNCAKCHDHKYDPISHLDYYRMRAVFEPHQIRLDPIPGETDLEEDGLPRAFDDHLDAITYLHLRGDPENPDKTTVIEPGIPSIFSAQEKSISQIELPLNAFAPATRPHIMKDQMNRLDDEIKAAEKELAAARKKFEEKRPLEADSDEPTQPQTAQPFRLVERFDDLQEDRWELVGEKWQIKDGQLFQTIPTREAHYAKLKQKIPQNFEFNCFYTHLGGTTYRSVTFRFDESEDRQNNNFVYTSAHKPGPKVQVAFTQNGQTQYPADARKAQPITEEKRYHLRFAVKDKLINVWLDDALVIAYQLPQRFDGYLSLSGFDSTVAFDELSIESLSEDIKWTEATNAKTAEQDIEHLVSTSEAKLNKMKLEKASIRATILADVAKFQAFGMGDKDENPVSGIEHSIDRLKVSNPSTTPDNAADLRVEAAIAQQRLKIATAKLEDLQSDKDLSEKIKQETEKLNQLREASPDSVQYASFKVTRKALESPADQESNYPATYSPKSTGRRKAFAEWITSRDNPLTARVAVNHVWMRHFGEPLVDSVFDFGLRAKQPLHQDILDALAAELMDSGWSFKHLHRIIVTSQTYLRSTTSRNAKKSTLEHDPDNQLYWRMNAKRMESQLLRDSLLSLSKQLNFSIGGPSLDHNHQPPRRGIYLRHSPDAKETFLETFDNADVLACYRRSQSIVPQQALAMVNSEISLSAANRINQNLHAEYEIPDDTLFTQKLFTLLLAREADEQEIAACLDFLKGLTDSETRQPSKSALSQMKARERLVHSVLNHHEFITVR